MLRTLLCTLAVTAGALKLPAAQFDRRAALARAATAGLVIPAAASASVSACPNGANNCWSTSGSGKNTMQKWVFPAGTDKAAAVKSLQEVVSAYPQAGQGGVDLGGWSVAEDALAERGYARYEFKSGIGNFAKFFNGGKPFVDDLELSVEDGFVGVRSSSRVGDSDFGVNVRAGVPSRALQTTPHPPSLHALQGKRVNYIASGLRAKGWQAPDVAL